MRRTVSAAAIRATAARFSSSMEATEAPGILQMPIFNFRRVSRPLVTAYELDGKGCLQHTRIASLYAGDPAFIFVERLVQPRLAIPGSRGVVRRVDKQLYAPFR